MARLMKGESDIPVYPSIDILQYVYHFVRVIDLNLNHGKSSQKNEGFHSQCKNVRSATENPNL